MTIEDLNHIIQYILAGTALLVALGFLVNKFMPKKDDSSKSCGNGDNCGCN